MSVFELIDEEPSKIAEKAVSKAPQQANSETPFPPPGLCDCGSNRFWQDHSDALHCEICEPISQSIPVRTRMIVRRRSVEAGGDGVSLEWQSRQDAFSEAERAAAERYEAYLSNRTQSRPSEPADDIPPFPAGKLIYILNSAGRVLEFAENKKPKTKTKKKSAESLPEPDSAFGADAEYVTFAGADQWWKIKK
jgi:hypothetical protein